MAGLRDLGGRVALVTGASSGIGRGLARVLAQRGARVALVARRADRLEELANELRGLGTDACPVACDVSDPDAVEAAAIRVVEDLGEVDLLVNAAGYGRHILFKDQKPDEMERMMDVNYFGVVRWIRTLLPSMQRRGQGWIINVSSLAGKLGQPDEASYSATKFAVTGLSESLAMELQPLGIHVLCVHPVLVRTEMFDEAILQRMPPSLSKSFIEVDEFSEAVLDALARGAFELTVPRRFGMVYLMRLLLPGLMRRQTAKLRFPYLPDLEKPGTGGAP